MLAACALAASAPGPQAPADPDANPVIATVLDKPIHLSQKDRLSGLIVGALLSRYADDNGLQPTAEEIATFVARAMERDAVEQREMEASRKRLTELLAKPGLSPAERGRLQADLKRVNKILDRDPGIAQYERDNPGEVRGMEEALARDYIRAWKMTRALHRQYGGRVVLQDDGPQPLDAYRDFLREQERKGNFDIADARVAARFWNTFTNDALYTFVATNRVQAAALLDTPWWLVEDKRSAARAAPSSTNAPARPAAPRP
jgi:hypothetical protein